LSSHGPGGSRARWADELMDLVHWQLGFGSRCPGSESHERFRRALEARLSLLLDRLWAQSFSLQIRGRPVECCNYIGRLAGRGGGGSARADASDAAGHASVAGEAPLLLGTHFDTRLRADRESDQRLRERPIPGANDGGSGTAVLLHLLERLSGMPLRRDVLFAFFDAEDVGDIDGHPFGVGARVFAAEPVPRIPEEVLILDMVGGKDLNLNIDRHVEHYPSSRRLTEELWHVACERGVEAFTRDKPQKHKYIICDHTPFLERGIPCCVLIDIDYPEWHTQRDLPDAMSGSSLAAVEQVVAAWIHRRCGT